MTSSKRWNFKKGSAGALLALMTTLASMGLLSQLLPEHFEKMEQTLEDEQAEYVENGGVPPAEAMETLITNGVIAQNGVFIDHPRFSTNGMQVFQTFGDTEITSKTVVALADPLTFEVLNPQYARDIDTLFVSNNVEACSAVGIKSVRNGIDTSDFTLLETTVASQDHTEDPVLLFLIGESEVFYKGEVFMQQANPVVSDSGEAATVESVAVVPEDLQIIVREEFPSNETAEAVVVNGEEYPLGIWPC